MRALRIIVLTGMCIGLSGTGLFAKQVPLPPKYDEAILQKDFDAFIESLDMLTISKDYPKAVRKLLSGDPKKQIQAVKTLAETGQIEVIPWLLLFLEAKNNNLRIWTGSSLEKLISSHVLKRRDKDMPESVTIKPLRPEDRNLRPLAWVVLKMFRSPDDGNTHAYAASMARYLGLHEFERELEQCLKSRHPAVSNKAKWALESLERQKEYEKRDANNDVVKSLNHLREKVIDFAIHDRDDNGHLGYWAMDIYHLYALKNRITGEMAKYISEELAKSDIKALKKASAYKGYYYFMIKNDENGNPYANYKKSKSLNKALKDKIYENNSGFAVCAMPEKDSKEPMYIMKVKAKRRSNEWKIMMNTEVDYDFNQWPKDLKKWVLVENKSVEDR